ncbi:MAG: AraC family ligand binding domain-containing protein, partial [Clostridiales bacterium]|nr:AraC family ligand binding domain-containing protein [Clostridiales bacterium]
MFDNLLSVLWIARYDYESGWKLKNHKHSFYQIVYIIDGKGYFLINNKIYDILPTRVFIIKPGQIHNIENNSKLIIKTLDIKFDVFDSRIKKILQNMDNFMGTDQSKIRTFLEEIKDEGNTKGVFYKEYSALYLFFAIANSSLLQRFFPRH